MLIKPSLVIVSNNRDSSVRVCAGLSNEFQLLCMDSPQELFHLLDNGRPVELLVLHVDNALESCKSIKPRLEHTPLIILADTTQLEEQEQLICAGASDYLSLDACSIVMIESRLRSHYELKRKVDLLTEVACLDSLTCIPNRTRFDELMDVEWRRSLRDFNSLSLVLIDVDEFLMFNENYGQGVGDNCLKRISKIISDHCLRAADIVARYEGDKFVVILPGTELDHAVILAENICRSVVAINIKHDYSKVTDCMTVSVGVVTLNPSQEESLQLLIDETENMLSSAKQQGGNRVEAVEL